MSAEIGGAFLLQSTTCPDDFDDCNSWDRKLGGMLFSPVSPDPPSDTNCKNCCRNRIRVIPSEPECSIRRPHVPSLPITNCMNLSNHRLGVYNSDPPPVRRLKQRGVWSCLFPRIIDSLLKSLLFVDPDDVVGRIPWSSRHRMNWQHSIASIDSLFVTSVARHKRRGKG